MGIGHASSTGMGSMRHFQELVSWQRMHELKIEIRKATEDHSIDPDFRDEIRDAADSAERNIEEGFGRYKPLVFANFLDFSRGSACETRSLLRKGLACRYFTAEQFDWLDKLAITSLRAIVNFQRFLRSPAAKRITTGRYQRPYSARIPDPRSEPEGSSDN